MNKTVQVSSHGHVTVVTLTRPDVRNAVDADTAHQLYEAFVGFESDPQARVAQSHGGAADPLSSLDFSSADYAQQGEVVPGPQGPMGPSRLMLSNDELALEGAARFAAGAGRHGKF